MRLHVATVAALQRQAAVLTERERRACTLAEALAWCIPTAAETLSAAQRGRSAPRPRHPGVGRKTRTPGKLSRFTARLHVDTRAALLRIASALTERDLYPCTLAEAATWSIHTATGAPWPTDHPAARDGNRARA